MKAGLALALLVAQTPAVTTAPAPQASPALKQIIDVKARTLCATLASSIQVTLVGLMKNDQVIEVGRKAFVKMGWDDVQGSHAQQMDRLIVQNAVSSMVRNLATIDRVLDDPARFPAEPQTDDERAADRMKLALQAVEDRQKAQLNLLNGTIETFALNDMQHRFDDNNPVADPAAKSAAMATEAPITAAGVQPPKPLATAMPPISAPGRNDLASTTVGGSVAGTVGGGQVTIAGAEAKAASIIVPVATECQASGTKKP
jgi:hypothetical protein